MDASIQRVRTVCLDLSECEAVMLHELLRHEVKRNGRDVKPLIKHMAFDLSRILADGEIIDEADIVC